MPCLGYRWLRQGLQVHARRRCVPAGLCCSGVRATVGKFGKTLLLHMLPGRLGSYLPYLRCFEIQQLQSLFLFGSASVNKKRLNTPWTTSMYFSPLAVGRNPTSLPVSSDGATEKSIWSTNQLEFKSGAAFSVKSIAWRLHFSRRRPTHKALQLASIVWYVARI